MKRLLALLLLAGVATALGDDPLPDDWRHCAFQGKASTTYAFVTSGNTLVIQAHARSSASCLVKPVSDPQGRLHWKWCVTRTIYSGTGADKKTDDFAARVWVGFEGSWDDASWGDKNAAKKLQLDYGFVPPTHWIHYVWAGRGRARGEAFDEPYKPERFKCISLRTALDEVGVWYDEERDVRADFKRLYGREAPRVTALGIMTDGDDTESEAEARYSDIAFVESSTR